MRLWLYAALVIVWIAVTVVESEEAGAGPSTSGVASQQVAVAGAGGLTGARVQAGLLGASLLAPAKDAGQSKLPVKSPELSARSASDQMLADLVDHTSSEAVPRPLEAADGHDAPGNALPHVLGQELPSPGGDGSALPGASSDHQPLTSLPDVLHHQALNSSVPSSDSSLDSQQQILADAAKSGPDHPRIVMDRSGDFFATGVEPSNSSGLLLPTLDSPVGLSQDSVQRQETSFDSDANGFPYSTLQLGQQEEALARVLQALQARATRGSELSQQEHDLVAQSLNRALWFKWLLGSHEPPPRDDAGRKNSEAAGAAKAETNREAEEELEEQESSGGRDIDEEEGLNEDKSEGPEEGDLDEDSADQSVESIRADTEIAANSIGHLVGEEGHADTSLLWKTYLPYGFSNENGYLPVMPPMHVQALSSVREAKINSHCREAAENYETDSKWVILYEACQEMEDKYRLTLKSRKDLTKEALRMLELLIQHQKKLRGSPETIEPVATGTGESEEYEENEESRGPQEHSSDGSIKEKE